MSTASEGSAASSSRASSTATQDKAPRVVDRDAGLSRVPAFAGLPVPSRFVRSQVEELRRADHKLSSIPSQRVADRYGDAIITSFRLELSLGHLHPQQPELDDALRGQLHRLRAAFHQLLRCHHPLLLY